MVDERKVCENRVCNITHDRNRRRRITSICHALKLSTVQGERDHHMVRRAVHLVRYCVQERVRRVHLTLVLADSLILQRKAQMAEDVVKLNSFVSILLHLRRTAHVVEALHLHYGIFCRCLLLAACPYGSWGGERLRGHAAVAHEQQSRAHVQRFGYGRLHCVIRLCFSVYRKCVNDRCEEEINVIWKCMGLCGIWSEFPDELVKLLLKCRRTRSNNRFIHKYTIWYSIFG